MSADFLGIPVRVWIAAPLLGMLGWLLASGAWVLVQDHARTATMWNMVTQPRPPTSAPSK